jgi:hypothetical protein
VLLIAVPEFVLRTLSDKWQCEVIGPGGDRFHVPAGSLSEGTRPVQRSKGTDSPWDRLGAGISPRSPFASSADREVDALRELGRPGPRIRSHPQTTRTTTRLAPRVGCVLRSLYT